MPNVCVEPRPKGRPEGSDIEDFVVEDHADHTKCISCGSAVTLALRPDWRRRPWSEVKTAI